MPSTSASEPHVPTVADVPSNGKSKAVVTAQSGINSRYPSLHLSSSNLPSTVWVVDSGATDHIVYSVQCLDQYQAVSNSCVSLPNGEMVPITHIGLSRLAKI
ncbi:hypothetical protein LINPERHAP1_LOCUS19695 [Linum perenne]